MAIATVKIKPFRYVNFVHLDVPPTVGPQLTEISLDVGQAFPTDKAAAEFWDELKVGWVKHVEERRCAQGKSEDGK